MPAAIRSVPPELVRLLVAGRGVFTAGDARTTGIGEDRLGRLVRSGLLERVGRGAFASREWLRRADPWTAYAIRTRGFVAGCQTPSFAADWSAVAVRGLPALGRPPSLPTVVQPEGSGTGSSRTRYGLIRATALPPPDRGQHAGCPTVGPAWMVVNLARTAERRSALVVADAVLANGGTEAGLRRALADMAGWPGVAAAAAAWVVEHADGRSESALETLGRLSCIDGGLPVPLSNVWVGPGHPLYRVDHLWPWHWVVAEGDGALKYRDAADPAAVVAGEKERQWRLETELGLGVLRYDWKLAAGSPSRLAARFRRILAARPARREAVRWWATAGPRGYDGQLGG